MLDFWLKLIPLVCWGIVFPIVISQKNVTKLDYTLCWACLMLQIVVNIVR